MIRKTALLLPILSLLFTALPGCRKAPQQSAEVVSNQVPSLPLEPGDPAWEQTPEHVASMIPQDLVEPRLMTPSTAQVKVRSLTNGTEIAFRLVWDDDTRSDLPGPARMVDACAVQIPEKMSSQLPDPQMGQEGGAVEITYWRADWQASVNGRGDTIRDLYPNASIDHYPSEAKPLEPGSDVQRQMALRYSPARALGNLRGGPRSAPVEDLIAGGPGTLSPGSALGSNGKGEHSPAGWAVVIRRKLPEGLSPQQRTHAAFAVWQGSKGEAGARKMRTGWIPLLRKGA
jgi:hypothetical protein